MPHNTMADEESTTKKKPTNKKGLPPISPRKNGEEDSNETRPVRRKKKKPQETTENGRISGDEEKPTPRRRARSATPAGERKESGGENKDDATLSTPAKKKRKPKPKTDVGGDINDKVSQEDVRGSKTSLIKDEGTPRKKGKKKKVKKTVDSQGDLHDFGDSFLATDLQDIREDIVGMETKTGEGEGKHKTPYFTTGQILHSQPLDKVFIETNRGFKGLNKNQLNKRMAEEREKKIIQPEPPSRTTLEFGLSTHRIFRIFCLFLHGLTAGFALWQIVIVYILSYFSNIDFLEHYRVLALPVQCMFYFLLALCVISACDRFDIGNPTRAFVLQALTMQNGAVSIIVYLVSLVLSLSAVDVEDRMHLYTLDPILWNSTDTTSVELNKFRSLNTARGVAAILGWLIIAISANSDRLSKNLHEGDDEILSGEMELDRVSHA